MALGVKRQSVLRTVGSKFAGGAFTLGKKMAIPVAKSIISKSPQPIIDGVTGLITHAGQHLAQSAATGIKGYITNKLERRRR